MKLNNPTTAEDTPVSVMIAVAVVALTVLAAFVVLARLISPMLLLVIPVGALARLLYFIFKGR